MRSIVNGQGVDITSQVIGLLASQTELQLATLYLIGDLEDPNAYWLTDWDSDLTWSAWGLFRHDNIVRGSVSSKIGLEVATLEVQWRPANVVFTNDINTTSPYQQAYLGKFDGAIFRSWTAFISGRGDVDTIGAAQLFGGRMGNVTVEGGAIKFTVNSFLDVVNQNIPGAVIESTSTLVGFNGATPPSGSSSVPTFSVVGGTTSAIWGNGSSFSPHAFQNGFLVFTSGTLKGMFSAVANYFFHAAGGGFPARNVFVVYTPFPWAPSVGDTFYVSAQAPLNTNGFPFVPAPEFAGV